jgi:hypothetical protein
MHEENFRASAARLRPQENDAVRRYGCLKTVGKVAEINLSPEVANNVRLVTSDLLPGNRDRSRLAAAVEEPDRPGAILEGLRKKICLAITTDAPGLLA